MIQAIYLLCALASALCAILLLRGYFRARSRLLLWMAICFVCLALNNSILFVDLALFPPTGFYVQLVRNGLTVVAGSVLLGGLLWELL